MEPKLAAVLDECLKRISEGATIDVCMAEHEDMRRELEPLLYTSQFVSNMPKSQPPEEFRKTARGRLMARIHEEIVQEKARDSKPSLLLPNEMALAAERLWQAVAGVRRIAVPVALCLVMVMAAFFGVSNIMSPSSALASGCTLSIISGTVEIQAPEVVGNQQGANGMTLDVGTRVMTAQDSQALLTFFDGSTLKLEPGTDIEIQQLELSDEQAVTIVLKQWMGRTWSRVVKMVDAGSHYEIQTPSAVALVRGTRFLTEVDDEGETTVQTTEGLVSVFAHGNEVFVSPGHLTTVELGMPPAIPVVANISGDEEFEVPVAKGRPENSSQQNTELVQGNAYGLDKDDSAQGNAYGLDKDDSAQGNAYGLDKDNNGQDNGNNGQDNANRQDNGNNGQDNGNNGQDNANGQDNGNNGQDNANGQSNGQDNGNNGQANAQKDKDKTK